MKHYIPVGTLIEPCPVCQAPVCEVPTATGMCIVTYPTPRTPLRPDQPRFKSAVFESTYCGAEEHSAVCTWPEQKAQAERMARAKEVTPSRCRECRAIIYFVLTDNDKLSPVNADGSHHWATCTAPEKFRKSKPKLKPEGLDEMHKTVERLEQGLSPCCGAPLDESRVLQCKGRLNGHGPRVCTQCKRVAFRV